MTEPLEPFRYLDADQLVDSEPGRCCVDDCGDGTNLRMDFLTPDGWLRAEFCTDHLHVAQAFLHSLGPDDLVEEGGNET